MKKSFFIFGAIISTLSTCFAELVPGATHVLNFTDEEVEVLQKVAAQKEEVHHRIILGSAFNAEVFEKYPPNILNKGKNDSIHVTLDQKAILKMIDSFGSEAEDWGIFSERYPFFCYLLLVLWYEKMILPPYNDSHYKQLYELYDDTYHALLTGLYYLNRYYFLRYKDRPQLFNTILTELQDFDIVFKPVFSELESISLGKAKIKSKFCIVQ